MRWLALLVLLACGRPAPRPAVPPAVPVLDEAAPVQHRRLFTLRGVAADEVAVRVFTDDACAGPVYLQATGAALRAGLEVELVVGVENVLTVNAVSPLGATSGCSSPLRLRYEEAVRPGRPSVNVRPSSPSASTHFVLVGAAETFARVQLHEHTCQTPVLAELSAAEFYDPGFPVDVPENGLRVMAVNAVNEDQTSPCVAVVLTNDSEPPQFAVRLASPSPSPQQRAWVQFSGEVAQMRIYDAPGCIGRELRACHGCNSVQVDFPADASTSFSALDMDGAGNSACVNSDQPWVHDPSLPDEQAVVLLEGWPLLGQVPAGRVRVELFPSDDCSGLSVVEASAFELVTGVYLQLPRGFITARTHRQDGGVDPCSNAVLWQ